MDFSCVVVDCIIVFDSLFCIEVHSIVYGSAQTEYDLHVG